MIVVASSKLAIASQTPIVPLAKLLISNTPIGPFQTTVFAPCNSLANNSIVFSPISKPSSSSGISVEGTVWKGASLLNSLETTVSTGKTNLSPAFSIKLFAKSTLSSSSKDKPTL